MKIKTWRDKQVAYKVSYTIFLPCPNGLDSMIVADLICHNSHTWKEHLVRRLFNTKDKDLILAIPLSLFCSRDFPYLPCWRIFGENWLSIGSYVNTYGGESFLEIALEIKSPPKIKDFWGGGESGVFFQTPFFIVLSSTKDTSQSQICAPSCDELLESPFHAFVGFSQIQNLWLDVVESLRNDYGEDPKLCDVKNWVPNNNGVNIKLLFLWWLSWFYRNHYKGLQVH